MVGRVSSPLFVGRRDELAVLDAALKGAAEGSGSVVMIGGEAGMGKSRLLAQLEGLASAAGATMVSGECLPLGDGELPYGPIVTALRSLLRVRDALEPGTLDGIAHDELVRLLPELGGEARPASSIAPYQAGPSARLFAQLLAVLVRLAEDSPIVLAVEDVHWSDLSTRDFLTFLVRGIRRERVALVLTYRDDEIHRRHPARSFLVELERSGQATRLELRGFGPRELREQVTAILEQEPPPTLLESLLNRAEGNPFFTEELLASVEEPDASLPESLRETMLLRIEGSSSEVRSVLRVAAVAGRAVDHSLLSAVAGIAADELLDAVRDAVQSHLLVEQPASGAYGFRHALLREAVYNDLLTEERRALHLRLAHALSESTGAEDEDAVSAELAHHWHAARQWAQALDASIEAGLQAENLRAPGEARVQYERALELWDRVDPSAPRLSRIEVIQRAGEASILSGHNGRAIALAREVIDRISPENPVALSLAHERLGRYLWVAGRGEEGLPEYQRAVALMPSSASRERAMVLAAEAQILMLCNYTELSEQRCEEALQIAIDAGAEDIEAHVLNTMCANFTTKGDFDEGVASAKRALEVADRLGVHEEIGRAYVNGSDALDEAGRVRESIEFARQGVESAVARGDDRYIGDFLRAEIASRLFRTGAWDEAEVLLRELSGRAASGINAGLLFYNVAELNAERGDYKGTLEAVERTYDHIGKANGSMWLAPVAASRASAELWHGNPSAALTAIDDCLRQFERGEYLFFTASLYELGVRAHADLYAVASDEEATRERELRGAEDLMARLDKVFESVSRPQPRALMSRALCVAELTRISGVDPDAWQEAERLAQAIEDAYRLAYARWRRAEALIESGGDRGLAQELAGRALRTADELGARPLGQAIEALMRAARFDVGANEHPPAGIDPGLDRFDLTPRELEVLALLGEGMTNREIATTLVISDKTASVHVSRILAKLSVANRASAAVLAQRLGVAGSRR